jgi:arylsulfatase A-like enzyme
MQKFYFLVISVLLLTSFQIKQDKKPNVIFILTDDQGYGDLSLHGNKNVSTPHLDQLGKESAQFDRFYVSPLCAPTRASFLTGRYHLRTGVSWVSSGYEVMKAEEETIAEVLKNNGYSTGIFGKWHNGQYGGVHPNDQGFDEFFGFIGGHWINYFNTNLEHNGTMIKTKGYITDILTEKAISFIKENKNKPFFCYLPLNAPHGPYQVADKYYNKYKAKGLDPELSAIYGMVENLDDNIGKLLAKIKEMGLEENTIIVFATDNGPQSYRYNANMKGKKGSMDEGGTRVPFFIKWKNKIQPKIIDQMAAHIDLKPTLLSLLNLKSNSNLLLDGIDISEFILSQKKSTARTFYNHVTFDPKDMKPFPGTVRTSQYRWNKVGSEVGLYDMIADPYQQVNLANKLTDLSASFESDYLKWYKEVTVNFASGMPIHTISKNSKKTILMAHDASISGDLKFHEGHAWSHDFITNWKKSSDKISWKTNFMEDGKYDVFIQYNCKPADLGSAIKIAIGDEIKSSIINKAFTPKIIEGYDRTPKMEAPEKTWGELYLTTFDIKKGQHDIGLNAVNILANEVAEIKGLIIKKHPRS